jgi:hypothetical protein
MWKTYYRLAGKELETVLTACTKLTQLGLSFDDMPLCDWYEYGTTFLPLKPGLYDM